MVSEGAAAWLAPLALAAVAQVESTTTVVPTPGIDATSTAADNPAQQTLVWIIGGLLVLAVVAAVLTVVFWRRTRPGLVAATPTGAAPTGAAPSGASVTAVARGVSGGRAATSEPTAPEAVPAPAQAIAPVRVTSPEALREVPLWADEPIGPDDRPR